MAEPTEPKRVRRQRAKRSSRPRGETVPYDVSNVKRAEWQNGDEPDTEPDPGSFTARVTNMRADLVERIKVGIPPRQYHAHSEGIFVKGKRHLIVAPMKTGKSLAMLVHWVRMVLAGERVTILDRENGADEYAERLAAIMDAWRLTDKQREVIRENLKYHDWPSLRRADGEELVGYMRELRADLVVFDSQRWFLADLGLSESGSDDYTFFMDWIVNPLHRAGITTVILDNTGHVETKRARGTSSKGDLNEVEFHMVAIEPFDKLRCGRLKLVHNYSRFGDHGSWTMPIGGGVFGEWESSTVRLQVVEQDKPEFKTAAYDILRKAGEPMGRRKLVALARKERRVRINDSDSLALLKKWAADPKEPLHWVARRGYACDL